VEFCSEKHRKFVAEILCKEIAAWSQIKMKFELPEVKPVLDKRKRERKSDSKLETIIK
jgi:hypothetical protein